MGTGSPADMVTGQKKNQREARTYWLSTKYQLTFQVIHPTGRNSCCRSALNKLSKQMKISRPTLGVNRRSCYRRHLLRRQVMSMILVSHRKRVPLYAGWKIGISNNQSLRRTLCQRTLQVGLYLLRCNNRSLIYCVLCVLIMLLIQHTSHRLPERASFCRCNGGKHVADPLAATAPTTVQPAPVKYSVLEPVRRPKPRDSTMASSPEG